MHNLRLPITTPPLLYSAVRDGYPSAGASFLSYISAVNMGRDPLLQEYAPIRWSSATKAKIRPIQEGGGSRPWETAERDPRRKILRQGEIPGNPGGGSRTGLPGAVSGEEGRRREEVYANHPRIFRRKIRLRHRPAGCGIVPGGTTVNLAEGWPSPGQFHVQPGSGGAQANPQQSDRVGNAGEESRLSAQTPTGASGTAPVSLPR